MPESTVQDPTDAGTLRPAVDPLKTKGTGFQPLKIPDFDLELHLPDDVSPDDPITLFLQYYTPNIVDRIVEAINAYEKPTSDKPNSRSKAWFPTCRQEIYLYLAFLIYMTVFPLNRVADCWSTKKLTPFHAITKVFSRNRFQELRTRFRVAHPKVKDLYQKTEPLNTHIQDTNCRLWKPGTNVAVDEAIKRFTGRSKDKTTVPNKPTPTGLKIWVVAQRGFFLRWMFHRPGRGGGPVGVRKVKGCNLTQSVVPYLLSRLPPAGYHVYLDNLFSSVSLFEHLRTLGHAATGTARVTSGIIKDLVDLKAKDKGPNAMPWGTIHSFPTESNMVNQTGFKDSAFALAMSTFWDGEKRVLRLRKRPKKTASNARTSRVPFGDKSTKELWIPQLYDAYNHNMGYVDLGDQLQGHNSGNRRLRRGPIQALHQFILLVVLSNCYLIAQFFDYDKERSVDLRSQDDFRIQLVEALIDLGKDAQGPRKRAYSALSGDALEVPVHRHELVKMSTRVDCVACKGGRIQDARPRKRVALSEIAINLGRASDKTPSYYGCKQCNVSLCNNNHCFQLYHRKS